MSEQLFEALFRASHDGVYLGSRDGRVLDVNEEMVSLFGYSRAEFLELNSEALFAEPVIHEQLQNKTTAGGSVRDVEVRLLRKDGREFTCFLTLIPQRSRDGTGPELLGVVHDVTERRHAEERIRHAALHDTLTQLPNRTAFLDRVRRLLERRRYEPEYRFAVLVVDLDNFKLVNDSLGHRAGDELLMMIAEHLFVLVRPEDIVARFGGDEFTILLLDLPGADEAEMVAERIQQGLRKKVFHVLGFELLVTASIGIALSTEGDSNAEELVRDADTAMHAAKEEGRGQWAVFDARLRERTVARFATETALQHALEREEFVLHYQPLVEIESRRIVGFEALLRWDHPERGLLPPAEFLGIAEETGLIVPIGRWVLTEACRVASEWREKAEDGSAPVMAVNLSARQLMDPGLGRQVEATLEATGMPAEALRLEITETILLKYSVAVRKTLSELDDLGVWLCLDDFGTGYSSLGYLEDLHVDVVKIDRSFVRGITDQPGTSEGTMAEAILSIARRLGVAAIAEGVETEEQREGLIQLGCGHAQGFLFAEPVTAVRARRLLDRQR